MYAIVLIRYMNIRYIVYQQKIRNIRYFSTKDKKSIKQKNIPLNTIKYKNNNKYNFNERSKPQNKDNKNGLKNIQNINQTCERQTINNAINFNLQDYTRNKVETLLEPTIKKPPTFIDINIFKYTKEKIYKAIMARRKACIEWL